MHEGGAQVQGRLMVVRDLLLGRMAASNLAMSRSCRDSASRYLQISPSSIVFSNSCVWSASFFPILTKSVSALNFLGEAICATQPAQQTKKAGPRAQQRRSLRLVLRKSAARARKSGCLGVCGVPKKVWNVPTPEEKMAGLLRGLPKIAAAVGVSGTALLLTSKDAKCSADAIHAPAFPWSHSGAMASYDTAR